MTIQEKNMCNENEREGGACVKCRYEAIKQRLYDEDLGEYDTYGICVRTESGEVIASVSDVSLDGSVVAELCRSFNERELSPLHLLDMIDKSI